MKAYFFTTVLLLSTAFILNAEVTITPLIPCLCEGQPQQAFEVQADGSAGPFSFSWAGPEGYTSDEQNPADMEVAGVYTLFITNAYGCTFSYDVGITACPLPTLQPTIHPACPDDSGGAIGLAISGGAPPFSFLWSNGADSQNLANLEPGQYTVTVSGANGCSLEQSFTVPASGEIPFSIQAPVPPTF
ncbi:MAG: SprB repeat-containing protein [Lewinellaceae bacterium]|nr:SprB repeat-containing protein [Lewinellaceae bacterium]